MCSLQAGPHPLLHSRGGLRRQPLPATWRLMLVTSPGRHLSHASTPEGGRRPCFHRPPLLATTRLPLVVMGRTHASTPGRDHARAFTGSHCLLPRASGSLHPQKMAMLMPPSQERSPASTPGRVMATLPHSTVVYRRAPPFVLAIPTPPLHMGAMPKPRLQEGSCPLLHQNRCLQPCLSCLLHPRKRATPTPL